MTTLLDQLKLSGDICDNMSKVVDRSDDKTVLSITIDKKIDDVYEELDFDAPVSVDTSTEGYDKVEI